MYKYTQAVAYLTWILLLMLRWSSLEVGAVSAIARCISASEMTMAL